MPPDARRVRSQAIASRRAEAVAATGLAFPRRGDQAGLSDVRMGVRGGSLVLRSRAGTHLATIDSSAFEVHAHVNPLRRGAGRAR